MTYEITKINSPEYLAQGIRLLCFDLDGTLIDRSGAIAPVVLAEIARVKKTGIAIAIATGRPLFACEEIIDQIGAESASIFYSGSFVTDVFTRIPILESHMAPESVTALVNFARKNNLTIELYTGEEFFIEKETPLTQIHVSEYLKVEPRILDLYKLSTSERFLKVNIVLNADSDGVRLTNEFSKSLKNCNLNITKGAAHPDILFYNFTNIYASRKLAFEEMLDFYRLKPNQVMAFGDAPGDQAIISLAGVGVAMGNADDETKKVADIVTESVDNQGVAVALQKIFI